MSTTTYIITATTTPAYHYYYYYNQYSDDDDGDDAFIPLPLLSSDGNPLCSSDDNYRNMVIQALPSLEVRRRREDEE